MNNSRDLSVDPLTHLLPQPIYHFRDALEALGGVASVSKDCKFISVTRAFEEMFGYLEAEITGKSLADLSYGTPLATFYTNMQSALDAGMSWFGDIPCRLRNGQQIMYRFTIAPSKNRQTGEVMGYIALYQHVMPLRQDLLSDLFYRYRAGFSKLAAMAVIAKSGEVVEINDAFSELYGYEPKDIVGQQINILRSGETPPQIYEEMWNMIESGKVWTGEIKNRCKDGRLVNVRSTISPSSDQYLQQDGGEHERGDAYLVIYQSNEAAVEARNYRVRMAIESTRQEMMAGTLHNVGNLLLSVVTSTDRAVAGIRDLLGALPLAREHLAKLDANCFAATPEDAQSTQQERDAFQDQVWALVESQLNECQRTIETGHKAVESTVRVLRTFRMRIKNVRAVDEIGVRELVEQWLEVFSPQVERHGVVVSVSTLPSAIVRWPLDSVQQIIFNFLKNSKEAVLDRLTKNEDKSKPWPCNIDLAIELDAENWIEVVIRDTGGGFQLPEDQMFKHGITTKATGTGIGLHNSMILATSLGGTVVAENITYFDVPGAMVKLRLPRVIEESLIPQ